MEILFLILKIIGWILLFILLFLILVLSVVLFVPFRYRFFASYYQAVQLQASVSWLLHMISVKCQLTNDSKNLIVRIFGIPVMDVFHPKEKKKKEKKKKSKGKQPVSDAAITVSEEKNRDLMEEKQSEEKQSEEKPADGQYKSTADHAETSENTKTIKEPEETEKKSIFRRIAEVFEKVKTAIVSFVNKMQTSYEKGADVKKQAEKWVIVLKREQTKKSLSKCKDILINLLKKILPRKWSAWIHFGLKDPATTSQILGYYWMFLGIFQQNITCLPDYENEIIEGEIKAKGSIQTITFLFILFKVLFDPDLKYLRRIKAEVDALK